MTEYKIRELKPTSSGVYDESGDMLPDMLNGGECPTTLEDMLDWLREEGYHPTEGFSGWGVVVVEHEESGELLNIVEI